MVSKAIPGVVIIAEAVPLLLAAVMLAGCGGGSQTPSAQDQIRATETKYIAAHRAGSLDQCRYVARPATCARLVRGLKAAGLNPSSGIPADWRQRISNATVTINGTHATITYDFPALGLIHDAYVRKGGRWVVSG
jgi:hypothetical protein